MDKEKLITLGIEESLAEAVLEEVENIKNGYEKEIQEIKKDFEIDLLLRDKGAKNIKAVKALIEEGDIEYVKTQVEKLSRDKDTRFLFESVKKGFEPYQSTQKIPDVTKNDYEARLWEARSKGNSVEAIKIKKQAASEGIMLI